MKYVRWVWRHYLASNIDLEAVPTLEEQDALTKPTSPIVAAVADVEESPGCLPPSPARPGDEEDWIAGDLIEVDEEESIKVKRHLRDLQELCYIKRRKVPRRVSEAVSLSVDLVNDAAAATSPGADSSSQPTINELGQELSKSKVKVVSLTAK